LTGLIAGSAPPESGWLALPDDPPPEGRRDFGAEFVVEWQVADHPDATTAPPGPARPDR